MSDMLREELERVGPYPDPADLEAVVRHVLTVYEDQSDDRELVTATRGVYGRHAWTGLTWGNLRDLAARAGIEV